MPRIAKQKRKSDTDAKHHVVQQSIERLLDLLSPKRREIVRQHLAGTSSGEAQIQEGGR